MKITMVGNTNSGKTVFTAAVYAEWMRKGFEKYQIRPHTENFSQHLFDAYKFAADYEALTNKRWPSSTVNTTQYALDLLYKGEHIAYTDWVDYRGGVLDNPTLAPEQASEVHAQIAASDALIFTIDGRKLADATTLEQARHDSGADIALTLLYGFSHYYPDQPLGLLIALTKCDTVGPEWADSGSYAPLVERGMQVFGSLHSLTKRQPHWRVGIVPVSTFAPDSVDDSGAITAFPRPLNVKYAMAFCVGHALQRHRSAMLHNYLGGQKAIADLQKHINSPQGMVRTVRAWFGRGSDDRVQLEQLRQEQKKAEITLERLDTLGDHLVWQSLKRVRILA